MQQRVRVERFMDRGHHRRRVDGVEVTIKVALDRGQA
jgi:hypothetical protein